MYVAEGHAADRAVGPKAEYTRPGPLVRRFAQFVRFAQCARVASGAIFRCSPARRTAAAGCAGALADGPEEAGLRERGGRAGVGSLPARGASPRADGAG